MKKTSDIVKMAIAIFLIIGGVALLSVLGINAGLPDRFYISYMTAFSVVVLLFMIISGTYFLISSDKRTGEKMMIISLFMQAFPFSIFGITFMNIFGSFIGVELEIAESVSMNIQLQIFAAILKNGFNWPGNIFYIGVNAFPLFLIWLMRHLTREEMRLSEVNAVLQNMNSDANPPDTQNPQP